MAIYWDGRPTTGTYCFSYSWDHNIKFNYAMTNIFHSDTLVYCLW